MYNVVLKDIRGNPPRNLVTWTSFKDRAEFDAWKNSKETQGQFEVVEEGISDERAVELCSTPEANLAVIRNELKKVGVLLV